MPDIGGPMPPLAVWNVVRVALPYADQPAVRHRPALVIAAPSASPRFSVAWVLMITTARHERWPGDVELVDWKAAGLGQPCVVRSGKVASIDTRITNPIGNLAEADRTSVTDALRALLREAIGG